MTRKAFVFLLISDFAILGFSLFIFLGALLDIKYGIESEKDISNKAIYFAYHHVYVLFGIIAIITIKSVGTAIYFYRKGK